ncbi:MAG: septum formation initiator family protein [Patescibacteria group bacterium]|jgi:cell division protein FtsB
MPIPAYVKYIALSILFIIATVNFSKTTISIIESSKRLDETEEEVLSLESERENLEKELDYRKSDEFIEEKARNDLNLIKPGERVYVVSEELTKKVEEARKLVGEIEKSNIQKWADLFF